MKYRRGMRKSWDDNAGCVNPPARATSVRLRAGHLSDESDAAARLARG